MPNRKENVLAYLKGDRNAPDPGIVLMTGGDFGVVEHLELPICERPIHDEGYDVFGVHWTAATPAAHYTPGQDAIYDDIEDWREQVKFPHVDRFDWDAFAAKAQRADRENKITTVVSIVGPFERVSCLSSFEDCLVNSMEDPEAFGELVGAIADYKIEIVKRAYDAARPEVFMFHDDWGTSVSTFFAPDVWRELFKPMYKDYIDIAHAHGKKAFMHSDGYILDIYPDLIELGLDAINSQLFCMGVENLAPFKGKITFWGEMDRQHLLVDGTPQDIEKAVRQVYDTLWANGKCIAQCEFGPGAKPENVEAVYRTWEELTRRG